MKTKLILVLSLAFLMFISPAQATCPKGIIMNPVTDLCWQCMFPFSIGGIEIMSGPMENQLPDSSMLPICWCPAPPPLFIRIGIPISFWEPARIIETVSSPYCFPALGGLSIGSSSGFQSGSNRAASQHKQGGHRETFANTHYMITPWASILEIAVDLICLQHSGFDIAYMTELDPTWANSMLSAIKTPESILFANPIAQLSCIADAVSSAVGYSLDPLFWCEASGGSVYPLSGTKNDSTLLMAHAGLAARTQYMMGRMGLACDTGLYLCGCIHTPIWVKHNYRHHIAKPVRDYMCHPFGRTDLLWGMGKNPPFYGDNFAWQIFRRRSCCAM